MDIRFVDFSANSAVFHVTKGLLFNRLISFKVRSIYPDKNDRNIKIHNEPRLKERLFERLQNMYNFRLVSNTDPSKYGFKEEYKKRMLISNEKIDIFELVLFQLSEGMEDDSDLRDIGGEFVVYPMTFVCSKCGDLQMVGYNDINKFDPKKCNRSSCNGGYEQLSLVLFCEICGNITPLRYYKEGKPITLIRGSKDSISTWKVRAEDLPPIDLFRLQCDHKDPHDKGPYKTRKVISNIPINTKQKALTVTEGSIFIPVAETSIDIPTSPDIDIANLEYILYAIALDLFSSLSTSFTTQIDLETIQNLYAVYNNDTVKDLTFNTEFIGASEIDKEKRWKEKYHIDKIENVINNIKTRYPEDSIEILRELNDYSALTGKLGLTRFETTPFIKYANEILNPVKKSNKINDFNKLKESYYIESLIYVPNVTLVNSCFGVINGINKFYEEGFVPHFEPIWKSQWDPNKGFYAYCYPYETEGIIIQLSKQKICEWLQKNDIISAMPEDIDDFFATLSESIYYHINTLLHTLSHLLMRSSSVYTGLDLQSYGEKVFPTTAAIFFYSSSSINIGGLQFIFENELFNWFEGMKYDVAECTLDPNCLKEKGACFACLYVPEFVCGYFNKFLDRDVLIGKERYRKGFWD